MVGYKPDDEDDTITDTELDALVYGWGLEGVDDQEEYLIEDD